MARTLRTARRMAVLIALAALAAFSAARANHFILPCGTLCSATITEFSAGITAGAGPAGITAGPDGNLWFTEPGVNGIGRITLDGVVTEFSAGISAGPNGITAGPDGNLWFTEPGVDRIGRITPQGVVTEFSTGITAGAAPSSITAGPDGNLWFTEYNGGRIGRITLAGVVTEFGVGITAGAHPGSITAGPDGNLWFTESSGGRIGRITPLGVVTEFSTGITAGAYPHGITAGPDGNLWFTECIVRYAACYGRIGRITPLGVGTYFAAPSPKNITSGPDGNLWFTVYPPYNQIGRITPAGVVNGFSASLSAGANLNSITAGPDGNLWFTEPGVNRIGRITAAPAPATATTIDSSVNPSLVGQAVTFTASVVGNFPTGTIQFKDGGVNLGSPITLSGGGIAQLVTSTLTQGTHSIVAKYSGDANNAASQSAPLSQVVNGSGGGGGGSINVALAANGGVASASSTFSTAYPVSAVNDGDRAGLNLGNGGVWKDATLASFPDWVQIDFNGAKTIDHVIVYSVQDDDLNPVEPSAAQIFTQRGITAFEVQAWNGAAWVGLGSISGNNLVKHNVAFAPIAASKIRVLINAVSSGRYSMATEIEAWTTTGSGGPAPTTTTLGSSLNPSTVGDSVTFTATVIGSNPTGSVNFTDGANSISGCAAVTLSSGSAQCATSALAQGTHSIIARYSGDANNAASQSAPLSQVVNTGGGGTSINAALAANGGVASASSTYTSAYPVSAVNDGDRAGRNFGAGGVWKDATLASFPDWVQIDFNGAKTIDHVIVYSVQDDDLNPVEPSATMTFTQRGITAFEVQSWNGAAWVGLGSISGNNLVKRNVAFAATTTSRIRVLINGISNGRYSLIAEIEAWTH